MLALNYGIAYQQMIDIPDIFTFKSRLKRMNTIYVDVLP